MLNLEWNSGQQTFDHNVQASCPYCDTYQLEDDQSRIFDAKDVKSDDIETDPASSARNVSGSSCSGSKGSKHRHTKIFAVTLRWFTHLHLRPQVEEWNGDSLPEEGDDRRRPKDQPAYLHLIRLQITVF